MRLLLLFSATIIFTLGLVMIFSTSSAEVLDMDLAKSVHVSVLKQLGYALFGIIISLFVMRMDLKSLTSLTPYLFLGCIILLAITLIPGIGHSVNGSRRWLGIGGYTFQPSEFVKYIVPAFFIYRHELRPRGTYHFRQFITDIALCSIPIILILVEPNNGTAAVIASTLVVLCLLLQIPLKYWALPLLVCLVIGGTFAWNLPYVAGRIKVYLDPELDLRGRGHQPYQAKIAAGSGGLWGKGAGNSLQKLSYLPEAQNDYIAAIFAEEFGYFGIVSLIMCYMIIGYVGFNLAMQSDEPVRFYLTAIITYLITFQAFLNLGVVSGILPSTGLNLPLFSQGGTSLVANIIAISLLFSGEKK